MCKMAINPIVVEPNKSTNVNLMMALDEKSEDWSPGNHDIFYANPSDSCWHISVSTKVVSGDR